MRTISSRMIKALVLMTIFKVFGTVSSASIFGFNLPSPEKAIQIGFASVPQLLDRFTQHPKQDYNSGFVNSPAFTDNRQRNNFIGNANSFYPTSNNDPQVYSSIPQQGLDYTNYITPGNSQNNANYNQQHNKDNEDSYNNTQDSQSLPPETCCQFNTGDNNLVNENASEPTDLNLVSTDTTATSDDEWTTTDEPLNRIGAPPAVVASLLG